MYYLSEVYSLEPIDKTKLNPNMTESKVLGIKILRELHNIGGCDATNDYDKGWDKAIDVAINRVQEITGIQEYEWLNNDEKNKTKEAVIDMIWDIAKISPEYGNALMDVLGNDVYEKIGKIANEE